MVFVFIRKRLVSLVLWLTSVIIATQEAKIKGIVVRSQPEHRVHEIPSQKPFTKKGWWAAQGEGSQFKP
jgi:hypothetical protein